METSIYTIKYYNQDSPPQPWNLSDELHFILSGSVNIVAGENNYELGCEDIIFINSGDLRRFSGLSWESVAISFQRNLLPNNYTHLSGRFDLCSAGSTYSTRYDFLRYCIFYLVKSSGSKHISYSDISIFFAVIDHISNSSNAYTSSASNTGIRNVEKLRDIIEYINSHYSENITLSETAAHFGLTSPYFSSFFKKYTGSTFSDYYNEVRLNHAVFSLLTGNDSIETIACANGFGEARAFTSVFKKRYNMLPTAYRKKYLSREPEAASAALSDRSDPSASLSDFNIMNYPALTKYESVFHEKNDFYSAAIENPRIIDSGNISYKAETRELTHNYHTMICVGSAKQLLYREVQDMLIRAQKEIGFRFIKFHGLLSDDMMVYHEDSLGLPHYSFTFVDKAFDFLLSIGIRPLCQLSFMPIELAEDPNRMMDFYHYNTSPPKSLRKWDDLVEALTLHLIDRYGKSEVSSWLFSVWNEPDETVDQFSWDDRYRFFEFFEHSFKAVKKHLPDVSFGTPSLLLSIQNEYGWAGDFFKYVNAHDCVPDFLNIHYYDNSLFYVDSPERFRNESGMSAENMERSFPLTVDPQAFHKFIDTIKDIGRKHNMKNVPIFLTEWNLTISHRDLINDTCFKSCHLIKNLLENYDRLSSFSYWCLTDYIEELQIPNELYHGGLGLFTFNGIPKANYTALKLLGKLGNELLAKGNGYFITRSHDRINIMLYNYEHYSRLFASGERIRVTDTDRYTAFEEMNTAQSTIHFTDLDFSKAIVTHYYVNQLAGSSYDAWAKLGTDMNSFGQDEMDILEYQSHPGVMIQNQIIEGGTLNIHAKLLPLEVRMIEVKLIH